MLEPSEVQRWERNLRAMLRKAGDEDPEGFAVVAQLLTQACEGLGLSAELLRARHGYSWAHLAGPLGISRQAAQQRYGIAAELKDELYDQLPGHPAWLEALPQLITLQVSAEVTA